MEKNKLLLSAIIGILLGSGVYYLSGNFLYSAFIFMGGTLGAFGFFALVKEIIE